MTMTEPQPGTPVRLSAGLADLRTRLRALAGQVEEADRLRAAGNDAGLAAALERLHADCWATTALVFFWNSAVCNRPTVLRP
jgi:hypothetical protein